MKKIFSLLIFFTFAINLIAKEQSNGSAAYLLKIEKSYSTCMAKSGGITSEMLDCIGMSTDKLDQYVWPVKSMKRGQSDERKKVLNTMDTLCRKQSAEHDGTSWSIVYADCVYMEMTKEARKRSGKHLLGSAASVDQ